MTLVKGYLYTSLYLPVMKKYFERLIRILPLPAMMMLAVLWWFAPGYSQEIVAELPAPGPDSRGLAWDGQYLWCADASMDKIYQLNPADGSIISSFNFALDINFGGLAWSPDGYLWISDFRNDQSYYYKVDPVTAAIRTSYPLTAPSVPSSPGAVNRNVSA